MDEDTDETNSQTTRVKRPKRHVKKQYKCQVCGDDANDHHHFGAVFICFSCKAFFRRMVRANCRFAPCDKAVACPINVESRTKCASCRYKKCLATGLDPTLVRSVNELRERRHSDGHPSRERRQDSLILLMIFVHFNFANLYLN